MNDYFWAKKHKIEKAISKLITGWKIDMARFITFVRIRELKTWTYGLLAISPHSSQIVHCPYRVGNNN